MKNSCASVILIFLYKGETVTFDFQIWSIDHVHDLDAYSIKDCFTFHEKGLNHMSKCSSMTIWTIHEQNAMVYL